MNLPARPRAPSPATPPAWAWALGLAGLLPFVALATAVATGAGSAASFGGGRAAEALAAYAATIAAFLGGVHWGAVMRGGRGTGIDGIAPLVWGVVPQLAAWAALMMPPGPSLSVLSGLLVACYAADRRLYPPAGLAAWLPLRLLLTVGAAASCTVAAWVVSVG